MDSNRLRRILGISILWVAAGWSATPNSWAQSVWVVDASGGAGSQFTNIQPAIDAAADRDIILVRSGHYSNFTILGKCLTIGGDAGAAIAFASPTASTIQGTMPWQSVVLRGLGNTPQSGFKIDGKGLRGPLWIEECSATYLGLSLSTSIALEDCASVVNRGSAIASDFQFIPVDMDGLPGLVAKNSNVAIWESTLKGGPGKFNVAANGKPGGAGCQLSGGTLFAAECAFHGGMGGFGTSVGGNGGAGILGDASAAVTLLNCQLSGGAAGTGGGAGLPGPQLDVAGPLTQLAGPSFAYSVDSPVREQQSLTFRFNCGIQAEVFLFVSPNPALPIDISGIHGPLLLDVAALECVAFGTLPAGPTTISIPVANTPPSVMGAVIATQPIFTDATLSFLEIGAPSHLVVLDSSL